MKIAIHHRPHSFSDHWIKYCNENNISFKIVNCYDSEIVSQLDDCQGLMWHWPQWDSKAILFARQLTFSLEQSGKKVFPNSFTCWHFDDKLGQKYLFECLGVNAIPTWVFYDKETAYKWIKNTDFPKVFKLRGGASSENVQLVKTKNQAKKLVKRAFGKGFSVTNKWNVFKDRLHRLNREKSFNSVIHVLKGVVRLFYKNNDDRKRGREKGYTYFQDFISGNDSDIRLVVVENRCYGMKRYFRRNDFRASGSGLKDYNQKIIDIKCVRTAFNAAKQLKMQSVAFDFINHNNNYKIIEVSYSFVSSRFPGYWDSDLIWHNKNSSPQEFMIKNFIKSLINSDIKAETSVYQD